MKNIKAFYGDIYVRGMKNKHIKSLILSKSLFYNHLQISITMVKAVNNTVSLHNLLTKDRFLKKFNLYNKKKRMSMLNYFKS